MSRFSPTLLIFIPFKLLLSCHKLMNLHIKEKDILKEADFQLIRIPLRTNSITYRASSIMASTVEGNITTMMSY